MDGRGVNLERLQTLGLVGDHHRLAEIGRLGRVGIVGLGVLSVRVGVCLHRAVRDVFGDFDKLHRAGAPSSVREAREHDQKQQG